MILGLWAWLQEPITLRRSAEGTPAVEHIHWQPAPGTIAT